MSAAVDFGAAAQVGDADRLNALVDWPVSGLAPLLRRLTGLSRSDRAAVAAAGVDNLLTEGTELGRPLGSLVLRLVEHPHLRPATDDETMTMHVVLTPPELPRDLGPDERRRLSSTLERASRLGPAWMVEYDRGRLGLVDIDDLVAVVRRL